MQFKFLRELEGFLRGQRLVERTGGMSIQVILDKPNPIDPSITGFAQLLHERRRIAGRASHADLDKTPAAQWFEGHQHTTGSLANIFVILTFGPAGFHGDGDQNLVKELTGSFIKTHDRLTRIIGLFVQRQNIFHMPNEIASNVPDAPALGSSPLNCGEVQLQ